MVQGWQEAEWELESAHGGQGLRPASGAAAGGEGGQRGVQLRGRGPEGLLLPGRRRSVLWCVLLAFMEGRTDPAALFIRIHPLTSPIHLPLIFTAKFGSMDGGLSAAGREAVLVYHEFCFHVMKLSLIFPAPAQNPLIVLGI